MTIFSVPPVEQEPRIQIDNWVVLRIKYSKQDPRSEDRILGTAHSTWRLSSNITHHDPERKEILTKSGRMYSLGTPKDLSSTCRALMERIKDSVHKVEDVTHEYLL